MSKLTKNDLKGIVKECLIEILAEGLISSDKKLSESTVTKKQRFSSKINKEKTTDSLFKMERPKKNIKTNLTDDPILNEILADTAMSTLQEQLSAESRKGNMSAAQGDQAAKIVAANNPEAIFGDSAAKWSKLAFFDAK